MNIIVSDVVRKGTLPLPSGVYSVIRITKMIFELK